MPTPTDEQVRKAIETVVRNTLAFEQGGWTAELPGGDEIEFQPDEEGYIVATKFYDAGDDEADEEIEKTYRFRVRVEPA